MTSIIAYTSTTGDVRCICPAEDMGGPHMDHCHSTVDYGPVSTASWQGEDHEPHCYECGRHTEHFAEHDSLVALGLVSYRTNGDVEVTEFARSRDGEIVRAFYDRGIILGSIQQRYGVTLTKPEGYALTMAWNFGIVIPSAAVKW